MRFGMRNLLFVVACVAFACSLFVAARNLYYSQRQEVLAVLNDVRGISNVSLHSHIDILEQVSSTGFSVDGQSDSVIELEGLRNYHDNGRYYLSRIGKWQFKVAGCRAMGAKDPVTGKDVDSEYFGGSIELGLDSPYKALIPFEINTLQDVVDHYQELIDLFETWPRKENPGTVTLRDGTKQVFHVLEVGK